MTSNKKLLTQALIVVIFSIILYRDWANPDVRFFYFELMCFIEVLIEFTYLFFTRNTIKPEERSKEIVQILIYLIAMVGALLLNMIITY